MSPASDYEASGPRVDEIRADLDPFLEKLVEHPWGGQAFDRLVLTENLPDELKRLLSAERYTEWAKGYETGQRIGVTGAMAFEAADGLLTAVVGPMPERDQLLALAAHEAVEAAQNRRRSTMGYSTDPAVMNGHVFWTEYVVERTRRGIFDELGLGHSLLDHGYLTSEADDLAAELPPLAVQGVRINDVPQRAWQLWAELVRTFASSQGRADAGYASELAAVAAFLRHPLIAESPTGWSRFREALRAIYQRPDADPADHDELAYDRWWTGEGCLYSAFGDLWNPRYAKALGVP